MPSKKINSFMSWIDTTLFPKCLIEGLHGKGKYWLQLTQKKGIKVETLTREMKRSPDERETNKEHTEN